MEPIVWRESYSVNVEEIDEEHKKLFQMIKELQDAMMEAGGQEILKNIVDGMIEYAATHFATEENYMKKFDYPEYSQHKAAHDMFVEKAHGLQEELNNQKFVLSLDLLRFLRDWLVSHILEVDKKYSPLFNENGLY